MVSRHPGGLCLLHQREPLYHPPSADTAGKWPCLEDITADFVYIRLHGDAELYVSGYTDAALNRWAARIRAWASGAEPTDAIRAVSTPAARRASRDVYCYFDNDVKVRAPVDAHNLMRKLGLPVPLEAAAAAADRAFSPSSLDALPFEAAPPGPRWRFQTSPARKKAVKKPAS